ncbi:MAG TPA: HAMP domain-containing sensor histidine kinase [Gaiellales bacterium]|nr:HAMP domain-containing sensor histidine kinase [Gaiellales bacterium]
MSFRLRLALLFAGTITVLVVATCAATYLVVRSNLRSDAQRDAARLAHSAASVEEPQELALDRLAGPDARVWVTNPAGGVVASSHAAGSGEHTVSDVQRAIAQAPDGATWAKVPRPGGGYAIVLLANSRVTASLSTLLSTLILVGLVVVLASGLLGALLARQALQPVDRMRRQADAIPGDQLDRRIDEGRPDELGRLAAAFNRLLARAQAATEQQRQFVGDASHELRTPVTALQGHARIVARAAERGDLEQARESATIVGDTAARMSRTVSDLLALAEADSARRDLQPVRLDEVAGEACAELRAAYPERVVEATLEPVTVAGDAGRLQELVRILLDNAAKYSPVDAPVELTLRSSADEAVLEVSDHGPGLADEDREHAFERFYRGAAAPGTEGSGLGLAIARVVVERHDGRITVGEAPGGGTVVRVELPAER